MRRGRVFEFCDARAIRIAMSLGNLRLLAVTLPQMRAAAPGLVSHGEPVALASMGLFATIACVAFYLSKKQWYQSRVLIRVETTDWSI